MTGGAGEAGGDPACWMHRLCPTCGRVREDGDDPATCPRCGSPWAADEPDEG